MNNSLSSNANIILEKVKRIDNAYDLLTEIFSDNSNYIKDPNLKYFIIAYFSKKVFNYRLMNVGNYSKF